MAGQRNRGEAGQCAAASEYDVLTSTALVTLYPELHAL